MQEKQRITEILPDTDGMSDGGESRKHGFDEVITNVAVDGPNQAYTHFMGLLQHDSYESNCNMMRMLGEAIRQKRPTCRWKPSQKEPEGTTTVLKARLHIQTSGRCHYGARSDDLPAKGDAGGSICSMEF